ncbi:TadE/TadG family type IV pilus assembly protein [Methylocystis parvus]|uniref:TadE/TadG family type IV pilus assembly protein n=1 Tax=Methylocystis parvus TaxID=134 RepID=UPI003C738CF7
MLKRLVKRLQQNESGIAAVEFGLILPLMLMIYMGLVELSRGMRAAQKLDLVAHTLADLTAQQLTGGQNTGQAGLKEADVTAIFSAANTLMAPLPVANLKMTISEVNITSPSAGNWQAKTSWTVTRNSATARPCQVLSPSTAAPVSVTTIPPSYVQVTNGVNPTTGPIIVADVVYQYSPGVHFEFFKWGSPPTWTMQRTSYAPVRNTYVPSHIQYFMTSGTNCNSPTP